MKSPFLRSCLVLCVLLTIGSAASGDAKAGRLTVDRYHDWEDVADPQLSPDGRQIVYERRWIDKMHDRWETSLWVMNEDGSKNRFLEFHKTVGKVIGIFQLTKCAVIDFVDKLFVCTNHTDWPSNYKSRNDIQDH